MPEVASENNAFLLLYCFISNHLEMQEEFICLFIYLFIHLFIYLFFGGRYKKLFHGGFFLEKNIINFEAGSKFP